jgi:hypothetical protein
MSQKTSKPVTPQQPQKSRSQLRSERRNRNYVIFCIVMVVVLGLSAFAPLIPTNNTQTAVPPTPTQPPVIPTPIADLSSISFDNRVVSESGLFSVAVPTGWEVGSNIGTTNEAQMTQRNASASSVIETRVILPTEPITDIAGVQSYFNDAWLQSSWRDYTSWNKSGDEVVGDNYIADFSLARTGSDFIARQEAWTDGTWLYMVRVVTPTNASDMLKYILEGVKASLTPNTQFVGSPFDWKSYFDTTNKYLIRFPQTWAVTDSASGKPTSLAGEGATIRIETVAATVADADAASAWVESTYGATVTSVEPVERFGNTGFAVAYQVPNVDGGSSSGYAVILNNGDQVSVADLRFAAANVDLNTVEADSQYSPWKAILDTFGIFPNITGIV